MRLQNYNATSDWITSKIYDSIPTICGRCKVVQLEGGNVKKCIRMGINVINKKCHLGR